MDLGLKDRVALVCGASKGLGKAVALGLALEGAKVAICSRNRESILRAADEIKQATGAEVLGMSADLAKAEDARKFFREALSHFGHIDILINNAGGPPSLPFADISDDQWQSAFELTLMSAVILIREALPIMKARRFGRIINMTSVAVKQPLEGLILSNTLRAGLIGLAKTLSNDYAPNNILINNVCPGYTLTERVTSLSQTVARQKGLSPEEVIKEWEGRVPMGRIGRPEELANLVVFLASERSSYITGTTIQVDGGFYKGLM
ncbi:MAG TPA: SDR family oxidoreductase [Thermodesulfobacteriota bacterium]|nr:SDR family oxidoreductase [Thermodesulfobacteriota bacterium]